LPFNDHSFDLVFAQFAFLWFADPDRALAEACRVLRPGGALVAIEPDYEAIIEYPLDLGLRQLWVDAIDNAGACPHMGRRLAVAAVARGLTTDVLLPERLVRFDPMSIEFLAPLLRSSEAGRVLETIRPRLDRDPILVHLPLILLHGQK
jgi:SAM-dependent methyltransferase